ncbi:PilZ domain-containing protein [bacterium]|nr:MAG: PilZ domain-containing protein [bacterium]
MHNRRRFPRARKPFRAVYFPTQETRVPAVGLDIGGGGLCLLTQEPLPQGNTLLRALVLIGERPVPVSGTICWSDTVTYRARTHYRYGLKFAAINDGDWDHIMRSACTGEKDGSVFATGSTLSSSQRDVLIPYLAQRRVVEALVRAGRLDQPRASGVALVQYRFDGYTMRAGVPYLRLTVRSRRTILSTVSDFSTALLVPIEDRRSAPVLLN